MTRARLDVAAVRAALSDPRAVARALGCEKGAVPQAGGGLLCPCPAHGNRSPSLSLQVRGGRLLVRCHGCDVRGDIFNLVAAVKGLAVRADFRRVLERAAALAGGVELAQLERERERDETPRPPEALAAALFARVCEAGRRRLRGALVEAYLERRGLLDAARGEGWAALPSLSILLDCAREVWEAMGSIRDQYAATRAVGDARTKPTGSLQNGAPQPFAGPRAAGEPSGQVSGGFAFSSPEDLLVACKLARRGDDGRLRVVYGRHRLVIPWRGRDGRVQALQRRLVDAPHEQRRGGPEPRYVLTWAPREPYGADRLGDGGPVIIVEGAVDALAARLLARGPCVVLGLPGVGAWQSAWATLLAGRRVLWGTDRGSGDLVAATGALELAERDGRLGEVEARRARRTLDAWVGAARRIRDEERLGRITATGAEQRRAALGPAQCVLCGAVAPLLCRGCGRVVAPGRDWGEAWERGYQRTRAPREGS